MLKRLPAVGHVVNEAYGASSLASLVGDERQRDVMHIGSGLVMSYDLSACMRVFVGRGETCADSTAQ